MNAKILFRNIINHQSIGIKSVVNIADINEKNYKYKFLKSLCLFRNSIVIDFGTVYNHLLVIAQVHKCYQIFIRFVL